MYYLAELCAEESLLKAAVHRQGDDEPLLLAAKMCERRRDILFQLQQQWARPTHYINYSKIIK